MIAGQHPRIHNTIWKPAGKAALFIIVFCLAMLCFTATGAEAKTLNINADKDIFEDDTDIYDYWEFQSNGTKRALYVGMYASPYNYSHIALGFNLAGKLDNMNVSSIQLVLNNNSVSGSPAVQIYRSNDDSWEESASTTFPLASGDALTDETITVFTYVSPDIKDYILSEYAGDQYATLLLESTATIPYNGIGPYASEDSTYDGPYLKVTYTQPSATISTATDVTEANLNGMELDMVIANDTFSASLTPGMFELNSNAAASGVSIGSVTRVDDTHATLRLQCASDIDEHFNLLVTLSKSALTSGLSTYSNTINVHVYDEITAAGTYDLDDMGTKADIVVSTTGHVKLIHTTSSSPKLQYTITYTVGGADLEIDNISIDNTNYYYGLHCISFTGTSNTLTLTGISRLKAYDTPAVVVQGGTALTIDGTGRVNTVVSSGAAAIGSGNGETLGTVKINGGTVNATGGSGSAGIGGGQNGSGGSVTINGGVVNADGGNNGAGIGSGSGTSAGIGSININGGTVTAAGGNGDAAGIGGGETSTVGTINITGGTVTAGYDGGAGIGCGKNGSVSEINISGGVVYAKNGSASDAGIGCDDGSTCSMINITGGRVYAEGNADNANDIGYGLGGSDADGTLQVSISGSSIVFLKNNRLSDRNDGISVPFHDEETIADHAAYGIPVPEEWSGTAYAYISDNIPATGISVLPETARLNASVSETVTLTATVTPLYASDRTVSYRSDNAGIATVDTSGVVTGIGSGTTTVTVTSASGGYTDTCQVTVYAGVTGVTLSPSSQTLILGDADTGNDTVALSATISPDSADDHTVSYESSDTGVAAVSASGVVTAVAAGTATITVTTTDGGYEDTCAVKVEQRVTGISVSPTTATLVLDDGNPSNDSVALTATVLPSDADEKSVAFKSSNAAVAAVDASGVVTALKAGTATITVTTTDGGLTASCAVTVSQRVTGISVSPSAQTLVLGDADTGNDTVALTATVSPSDADDQTVSYTSSDISVATVDASGVVTALKAGTATITAKTVDGEFTDTCAIKVEQRVTGFSVSPTTATLVLDDGDATNDSVTLTATITPSDADEKGVAFISSNPAVAAVDASGVVTALKAGTTTITATTTDGGLTADCDITVNQRVTGLTVFPAESTLVIGDEDTTNDTVALTASVSPEDADEQGVTYESSDTDIATVDESGIVTAVKKGTAVITAATTDGNYTATCDITVDHIVRLIPSSDIGKVCVGCPITLTPSVDGGSWVFDPAYLSKEGNVFTPLKPGTSIVTYSVEPESGGARKPLEYLLGLLVADASADENDTASYTVTAEELALASTAPGNRIQIEGTVTLTPNFEGGSWTFNSEYLEKEDNVFTGLRVGTTTITYTYESQTVEYELNIFPPLPQTSDGSVSPFLFVGIGLLSACLFGVGIALRKRLLRGNSRQAQ